MRNDDVQVRCSVFAVHPGRLEHLLRKRLEAGEKRDHGERRRIPDAVQHDQHLAVTGVIAMEFEDLA